MPVFCSSVVSSDAASTDDLQSELVRHYLIEAISSPPRGVRLKGFASEPIFPSLVSLIHQHTHAPLALPCRLLLPEPVAGQMPTPGYQTLPAIVMGPSQANANVDALETDVGMAEAGNFGCLEPEIRPQARQRGLPSAVSSSASETFNYYHQMQQQHQQQYQTGQHHYQHPVQAHLQHQQTETGMEVAGGGMSAGLTPRVTSPMPPVSSMISPMSPISPTPGMFQSSGPGITCRSLFLGSVEIESLTGEVGLARAVDAIIPQTSLSAQACDQGVSRVRYAETLVRLVPGEGVTLTDVHRRLFFRRQFAEPTIVYAGIEPRKKEFIHPDHKKMGLNRPKIFGFIIKKLNGENVAHIFCEYDPSQPATAVVSFIKQNMIRRLF